MKHDNGLVIQLKVWWLPCHRDSAISEDYGVLRLRFPMAAIWTGAPSEERENVTPVPDDTVDYRDGPGHVGGFKLELGVAQRLRLFNIMGNWRDEPLTWGTN